MNDPRGESAPRYDSALIKHFFDGYGSREWERLDRRPMDRINFEIHRRYLARFVHSGEHVLEIGAGPGRFTIELARRGARVTVTDISPRQLELNREKVAQAGAEDAVVERSVLDVVDLGRYAKGTFDCVVCYGGPLSYVLERADDAVAEIVRVTKPGGVVLCSVMSLVGSLRASLSLVLDLIGPFGVETVDREVRTGDVAAETARGQAMRLYRWSSLKALLERHQLEIVAVSAANFLSVGQDDLLVRAAADNALWSKFVEWEVSACEQPGAVEGGTHIITAARRLEL